jgi:outer membrane protein assembly factor BamB
VERCHRFKGAILTCRSERGGVYRVQRRNVNTPFRVCAERQHRRSTLELFAAQNVVSSPAVVNGVVYISSGDATSGAGTVYALNASTGALLWSVFRPTAVKSSLAVANGVVYFGDDGGEVSAVNASSGTLLWAYDTADVVQSSPAVANGVVYFGGGRSGTIYALNASTGALQWNYATGRFVQSSPAVANGVVYIGSGDFNVYALNASTGGLLWRAATGNNVPSSPAVANGVVYVGSTDGTVYALNASTGAILWNFDTGVAVDYSPTVANGVLYVCAGDLSGRGIVYAFGVGADLFLRVQPSAMTVQQGDLLTYAFTVWNLGPENADHEVLKRKYQWAPSSTTSASPGRRGSAIALPRHTRGPDKSPATKTAAWLLIRHGQCA